MRADRTAYAHAPVAPRVPASERFPFAPGVVDDGTTPNALEAQLLPLAWWEWALIAVLGGLGCTPWVLCLAFLAGYRGAL